MFTSKPSRICQNFGKNMSSCGKSSISNNPKPINIFYIWYGELCRRLNVQPLSMVKPAKPKNETVLDFVADRIKAEEWMPILNALRQDTSLHVVAVRSRIDCKFFDDVDTERKAREAKRKVVSLYTDYVLRNLITSLAYSVKRSQVLTCLELDGLPIVAEYLQPLLDDLSKNKTLKVLSLKRCPLRDYGCQQLCMCIRYISNIEVLNLTACGLGSLSAQYIANVIRYQQIQRYCESWHASLRYEDPDLGLMTGLKRITLNNNPNIGDEGLIHILNELDDDLWIKAIDMQKCNITENVSSRLIDVIDYSKSLEVADFRNNDQLRTSTIEKILSILNNKQRFGCQSEFQWCLTATTIPYENCTNDTNSLSSSAQSRNLQKTKSAPLKQVSKRSSASSLALRRIKTVATVPKVNSRRQGPNIDDVAKLHSQLKQEIAKRLRTEKENETLQKRLAIMTSSSKTANREKEKFVKIDEHRRKNASELVRAKDILSIKLPSAANLSDPNAVVAAKITRPRNPSVVAKPCVIPNLKKTQPSNVEFVFTLQKEKEKNLAQSLFENIVCRNGSGDDCIDDDGENIFQEYFGAKTDEHKAVRLDIQDDEDSMSDSNASLLRFVEEIKSKAGRLGLQNKAAHNYNRNSNRHRMDAFQKLATKVPPVS